MLKKMLFFLFAASIFLMSCNWGSDCAQQCCAPGTIKETVSVKEASELAESGVLFIDVRQPDEVAEMGYEVSTIVNIPLDSLENHLVEIPKDQPVILVCRSGNRSAQAFDILKSKGFENISKMDKGIVVWNEAGFPVMSGSYAPFSLSDYQSGKCCGAGKCGKGGKACCGGKQGKCCKEGAESCKKSANTSCVKPDSVASASLVSSEQPAGAGVVTAGDSTMQVIQFHSEHRCMTCLKIEKLTKETLAKNFPDIPFKLVNVDDKQNKKMAERFGAFGTALFLFNPKTGETKDLTDFAFMKVHDEAKYEAELKTMIEDFLKD